MRIAVFSETFPPQRTGVAVVLERLVRHLAQEGHEVLLAVPVSWRPRGSAAIPDGVRLVRVPGVPLPLYPDLTLGIPHYPTVGRAVRAFRPDVIHLVTEYALGLTGLRLARQLDVPAVASFHSNIPGTLPYYGLAWASNRCWAYLRWFHSHARVTFCPSETNRRVLESRGFRNVRVWARGVDTDRFAPRHRSESLRKRLGSGDSLHLLYVGRLAPEKDLPVLFEAYRRLARFRLPQDVRLTLVGDGSYSARTRSLAPAGVTFTGHLEGPELSQAYSSADVFVFPSRVETLGNVVLEAFASGLPVVGVAEGGTLENVVDGVNGVLCAPGDPDALAAAVARLAGNADLRRQLSENARRWAEERTWERAFAPLTAAYRELASS
jgi:glycosyltransferase involved in cell wall biosynthesis